jgi:hypothetical protein
VSIQGSGASLKGSPQPLLLVSEENETKVRVGFQRESNQSMNPISSSSTTSVVGDTPLSVSGSSALGSESLVWVNKMSQIRNATQHVFDRDLEAPVTKHFCLIFERIPMWLYCLHRETCHQVTIYGHASASEFIAWCADHNVDPTLINLVTSRLGTQRLTFVPHNGTVPVDSIVLVSGSMNFLTSQQGSLNHQGNVLFLLDEHLRSKVPSSTGDFHWQKLRHCIFGGSTGFTALVGSRSRLILPEPTGIRRSIAHIVDHALSLERNLSTPPEECYTLDAMLRSDDLDRPVRYPTSRFASGWAIRSLTCDEIGVAFGLPVGIRSVLTRRTVFPLVPIQILDACLKTFVCQPADAPHFVAPVRRVVPEFENFTWLSTLQLKLPHSWIDSTVITAKAARSDDADVPVQLWDLRIILVLPHTAVALDIMRKLLLLRMRRGLAGEFIRYLTATYGVNWRSSLSESRPLKRRKGGLGEDLEHLSLDMHSELAKDVSVGFALLAQWAESTWWTWNKGSTLIFWRWPIGERRRAARDGMAPYILGPLPRYMRAARKPKPEMFELILPKLQKFLNRGYVHPAEGNVYSLIDKFAVPKADDIRVVLNGTSCGLNDAVWAPNFWLPTSNTAANLLNYNYCSVDVDLGEMFYNFPLTEVLRKHSGIDFTPYKSRMTHDESDDSFLVRWLRCWMGLRPSPYYAVRYYYWAEELVRGNRRCPNNPLRWDEIRINCPGNATHDPTLPRVMKWNKLINNIAGDIVTFVDDLRLSGATEEQAWAIGRRVASTLQYLGVQDAPRKRKPPVRITGAWAGTMFAATAARIEKFISQAKWNRGQDIIAALLAQLEEDIKEDVELNYKKLEQDTGFLCHLAMTYERVMPYLKGFYLTLSAHLPQRDEGGWKKTDNQWAAYVHQKLSDGELSVEQAAEAMRPPDFNTIPIPVRVKPVERLLWDVRALSEMFKSNTAPKVCVRSAILYILKYGFVDASGCGLGATMTTPKGIRLREGIWGIDSSDESSNWREYTNLVQFLEDEGAAGHLTDATIYICTDNSVAESAANRSSAGSEKLFNLTVRLRNLEMKYSAKVVVTHVSGERMKAQGTDGTSRGLSKEGVTMGRNMLTYIPFDETCMERSPKIETWIRSWVAPTVEFLKPEGWFERGHDISGGDYNDKGFYIPNLVSGTFIWTPPPAAAGVALEQLRQARIKRQNSLHVFVCPRLMTCEWIKQLWKAADVIFEVPIGSEWWPSKMHEPLTIGILFPFIPHRPWQLQGTPKMLYVAREVRRLSSEKNLATGDFLRQFLLDCKRLQSLSKDVVWKMLHFRPRSKVPCQNSPGRKGNRKRTRPVSSHASPTSLGREASVAQRLPDRKKRRPHDAKL